jgi:hypothetical protein
MIFGDILCSFLACTIDVSILPASEEISDRICLYVVGLQFSRETSLASSMKANLLRLISKKFFQKICTAARRQLHIPFYLATALLQKDEPEKAAKLSIHYGVVSRIKNV